MWDGRFLSSEPKRGDVIVFRKPGDRVDYVKRLIGMPGDTVQMVMGRLYINGEMVERSDPRPYVIANLRKSLRKAGYQAADPVTGKIMVIKGNKIYIDNKLADFNYTIEYKSERDCDDADQYADYMVRSGAPDAVADKYRCKPLFLTEYTETLPGGRTHSIVEISDADEYDATALYSIPAGHYFMMGDDRDLSADSRSSGVGYVPRDNLMGRAWTIWYSHNYYAPMLAVWNWGNKMRMNRFFMGIK